MSTTTENLSCQWCGTPMKSASGRTLHEKSCGKKPNEEDYVLSDHDEIHDEPRRKPRNTKGPDFGAFFIFGDHLPMVIDLDLAAEIGRHILKHGSQNSAVMAFGHQLMNYASTGEE